MGTDAAADPARITAAVRGYPLGNLDVIEEELQRQRASMSTKVGNTYTRATILIGAAGVLGGVSVTGATDLRLWVLLVSLGMYAVAAGCGLLAMRPLRGDEVDVELLLEGTPGYSRDDVRRAVLASNLVAHRGYRRTLTSRTRWIVAGFLALTLAWVGSTLGSTTDLLGPMEDAPVTVRIVDGGQR